MTQRQGGCLCGAVQYVVEGELSFPHLCSCLQCQRWAGAPVMAWVEVEASRLRWVGPAGEPRYFRSSAGTQRGFCPECGSNLCAVDDGSPWVSLTGLGFDPPLSLVPESQSFRDREPEWLGGFFRDRDPAPDSAG